LGVASAGRALVGKNGEELALLHGDGRGVGVDHVGRRGEERRIVADGVLAGFVEVGDEFVQFRVGVVTREPERFAVVRVVGATASIVVLLLTLVQDWDAISDHSVSDDIAGSRNIVVLGREARVVVVLAE
jgi:hypothetical protein